MSCKLLNGYGYIPIVACKYSVLTEIIGIFKLACKACIHDEDVAETDFEYTFETPKGFRSDFGKPCAPSAVVNNVHAESALQMSSSV
jgi:hypothetical protein